MVGHEPDSALLKKRAHGSAVQICKDSAAIRFCTGRAWKEGAIQLTERRHIQVEMQSRGEMFFR